MGALREHIKRLRSITIHQQEADILNIVKANEPTAVDLNLSQLLAGRDSNGEMLFPPYSEPYARYKDLLGMPSDRVTLKLSGDFHNSFFMNADKWPVFFDATDPKTDKLKQNYGGEIFGLDQQSLEDLNKNYLLVQVQEYYKTLLLLR